MNSDPLTRTLIYEPIYINITKFSIPHSTLNLINRQFDAMFIPLCTLMLDK